MEPDMNDKYPYGNPSWEYANFKGWQGDVKRVEDEPVEVSNHDLLVAFLRAADAVFHELGRIRAAVEKR